MKSSERAFEILGEVKLLAREYHELTGKPLGVTAEVAEYEAARILNLELSPARQSGYDAIRTTSHPEERLQIKGRRLNPASTPGEPLGAIDPQRSRPEVAQNPNSGSPADRPSPPPAPRVRPGAPPPEE